MPGATITQVYKEFSRGGIEYSRIKVSIPTASVLALNGTPITVISAPGSNRIIECTDIIGGFASYGGTAYTTHGNINVYTDTATLSQYTSGTVLNATVVRFVNFGRIITDPNATDTMYISNKALKIISPDGNPAVGNSDLILYIDYKIYTQ